MSRIRANQITNQSADGAPTVQNGLVISGVTTSTTFSGSGASLTNLNASNIASGTVPTARLGSGTANSSTFLRGDSTFATVTSTTINNNADNRLITGSGTANTLEGESTITYSNPTLEINTDTSPYGTLTLNGNSGGLIQFEDNETTKWSIFGESTLNFYDNSNSASRLLITSDGKITTPLGTSTRIGIADRTSGTGAGGSLLVTAGSARGSSQTTGNLLLAAGRGNNSANNGEIRFGYNDGADGTGLDQEHARITSNGCVNIGGDYTNTTYELSVTGGSSQQMKVVGQEADIWLESTGGSSTYWRILGSTGGSTHKFRIFDQTNTSDRLNIDTNGQVTKPAQASFSAYVGSNAYGLHDQVFPFNNTTHNIGGHFNTSNYRFTAPVAGRYQFNFHSIFQTSGQIDVQLRINNSSGSGKMFHVNNANSNWDLASYSNVINLNANDYVTMWSVSNVGWHGNNWGSFSGELLS